MSDLSALRAALAALLATDLSQVHGGGALWAEIAALRSAIAELEAA